MLTMMCRVRSVLVVVGVMVPVLASAAPACGQLFDETPGRAGEWGFRPASGSVSPRNPPTFSWRPQPKVSHYELQVSATMAFDSPEYVASDIEFSVHCPTRTFDSGTWYWRVRGLMRDGSSTSWSSVRSVEVQEGAAAFALPSRDQLMSRVPDAHPRLFVRPERIEQLRSQIVENDAEAWSRFVAKCERILADPPATEEPPKYEDGMVRGSDPWRAVWWGNRKYTIALLDAAASLGFAWQMTGDDRYASEARRLLMAAAEWDPRGSTGYRYNDEAGMPYAYHFSRTYTFIHDVLTDDERQACRAVMRVRGREMYAHLCPRHLWRPYSSHSNRAWHFLGEVGIAFHGEIPEADDWLWFAVNVFANAYPVWSDADGGWHEGVNYWSSYLGRFTWWADVMREAVGLNAYDLPYFSKAGYYGMTMMPPGMNGGGFGDLNARMTSSRIQPLMTTLAVQSRNPHWQWYVDQHGGPSWSNDYVALLRRALQPVEAVVPDDLAGSRLFAGTGQAVLNSNLKDARDNVRIIFKSSPFGTQSHAYEAQNSFIVSAWGKPLLIRSGYRDSYGSDHHKKWMWHTKSVNSVLVDGMGQRMHSAAARGRITHFETHAAFDYVEGEAAGAYERGVESFRRGILFLKPDCIIVMDRVRTSKPVTLDWLLHAPNAFELNGRNIVARNEEAMCTIVMLQPVELEISQTAQFDPPPRPRIQLVEHHLRATTTEQRSEWMFVTVIRPSRHGADAPVPVDFKPEADGHWSLTLDSTWMVGTVTWDESAGALDVSLPEVDRRIPAFMAD